MYCCFVVYSAINEALKDALNSDAYQQKVKESQGLLANVSKLSGVANLQIENISLVADQLFCAEAHEYNNCLLPSYTKEVKELADFYVCLLIFLSFYFYFSFLLLLCFLFLLLFIFLPFIVILFVSVSFSFRSFSFASPCYHSRLISPFLPFASTPSLPSSNHLSPSHSHSLTHTLTHTLFLSLSMYVFVFVWWVWRMRSHTGRKTCWPRS